MQVRVYNKLVKSKMVGTDANKAAGYLHKHPRNERISRNDKTTAIPIMA